MIKKEILIGFIVAIFATTGGFYLYLEYASNFSFEETLKLINEGDLYGKILGIAALPNLLVFFIYLKKKQDLRAKGVLLATFFIALLILISQFV